MSPAMCRVPANAPSDPQCDNRATRHTALSSLRRVCLQCEQKHGRGHPLRGSHASMRRLVLRAGGRPHRARATVDRAHDASLPITHSRHAMCA